MINRWLFQSFVIALTAMSGVFGCPQAHADWNVADVQCTSNANRVLIRFGMNGRHDALIPQKIADQWNNVPIIEVSGTPGSNCSFKDGQNISISITTSEEVKTIGGGDLNGYFSFLINGRPVYKNE